MASWRRSAAIGRELATTGHVVLVLCAVELVIRWVPLPRLARVLGVRLNLDPPTAAPQLPVHELSSGDRRRVRCTRRVANRWPLAQGPCLRRALVAGHLLRDRHPAVRLGVVGSGADLTAHAWLELDGRPLEDPSEYGTFHHPVAERSA